MYPILKFSDTWDIGKKYIHSRDDCRVKAGLTQEGGRDAQRKKIRVEDFADDSEFLSTQ